MYISDHLTKHLRLFTFFFIYPRQQQTNHFAITPYA